MKLSIPTLTVLYNISEKIFYVSCVIAIVYCLWMIYLYLKNKPASYMNKREKLFPIVGIAVIVSLFLITGTDSVLSNAKADQEILENEIAAYDNAIEYMGDGKWYKAAIEFNKAGDQNNAEILRDYCYYIYLSDEHPDWVPWMGISEITGK